MDYLVLDIHMQFDLVWRNCVVKCSAEMSSWACFNLNLIEILDSVSMFS